MSTVQKLKTYLRSILSKNLRRIDIKEIVFQTGLSHDEVLAALQELSKPDSN